MDVSQVSVVLGAVATISVVCVSLAVNRIGELLETGESEENAIIDIPYETVTDNSSLEEDFRDILAFIPLEEVKNIVENFVKFDKQVNDTVCFINDQKKFIWKELRKIPQFNLLMFFIREHGLKFNEWTDEISVFWKSLPSYDDSKFSGICGGLTTMISKIVQIIPLEPLQEHLNQKYTHSHSFRSFILALRSQQFIDMCEMIEHNAGLQRNFYWAKEAGLEVVFALELLSELYEYITEHISG